MIEAKRYRKKPVEIEAVKIGDILDAGVAKLPPWVVDAIKKHKLFPYRNSLDIVTLEGRMVGDRADMLIKGVAGELYPCKESIFQQTYELVE